MSFLNELLPRNPDGILGRQATFIYGTEIPNSTARKFLRNPIGTQYIRTVTANQTELWIKGKEDRTADDWVLINGRILQTMSLADLTDGGAAVGTADFNGTIPAGCYYDRTFVNNVVDWVGSAAVTFTIGEPTTPDVDRYMTGTPSLAATAAILSVGDPSGTRYHAVVMTPRLYVTDDSDFGDLTSGSLVAELRYFGRVPANS